MKKFTISFLILIPMIFLGQNIIHVPGDYATIQEGIDAATDFDTVLVAPGIYTEHLAWHNKTIVLASHFLTTGDSSHIENTIIDGTEDGRVLDIEYANPGSELIGFTIVNGFLAGDWGGGIDVFQSSMLISDLIITNCTADRGAGMCITSSWVGLFNLHIENNEAADRAAGIWAQNSSIVMNNSHLIGNSAPHGAAMYVYFNSTEPNEYLEVFEACSFTYNIAEGGTTAGLLIRNNNEVNTVDLAMEACEFSNNEAYANGALQIRGDNVTFELLNCRIINNQVEEYTAGLAVTRGPHGEVVNSIFASNTADIGGANWSGGAVTVWGEDTEVEFINCTFADNSSAYGNALCVGPGSEAFLLNNIIWDNGNIPIALEEMDTMGATAYLDYNDLQYGLDSIYVDPLSVLNWGDHNIIGDPQFDSPGDDHYAITSGSPCVDAGTPDTTGMDLPPFDIIGNVRVWDGGSGTARIDMGAYEYDAPVWVGIEQADDKLSSSDSKILIYPNPASDWIHILCEKPTLEIRIYDQQGRLLVSEDRSKVLDVSALKSGLYFVEVLFSESRDCRKLIID